MGIVPNVSISLFDDTSPSEEVVDEGNLVAKTPKEQLDQLRSEAADKSERESHAASRWGQWSPLLSATAAVGTSVSAVLVAANDFTETWSKWMIIGLLVVFSAVSAAAAALRGPERAEMHQRRARQFEAFQRRAELELTSSTFTPPNGDDPRAHLQQARLNDYLKWYEHILGAEIPPYITKPGE